MATTTSWAQATRSFSLYFSFSLSPFADRVHKMLKYSWSRTTRDIPPRMFSFLSLYLFLSPFSFFFFDSSSINSNRVRFAPLKYCEKCVFHDVPWGIIIFFDLYQVILTYKLYITYRFLIPRLVKKMQLVEKCEKWQKEEEMTAR